MPDKQKPQNAVNPPVGLRELLAAIEELADKECACTIEQQKGVDPSVCISCLAAKCFNEIAALIRYYNDLLRENNGKEHRIR